MPDIKTRDTVKGTIKTLDKAAIARERMKEAYVRTKEKAEHGVYSAESSPEEYAADRFSGGTETVTYEAAHQFDKQGRKGVQATRENISKAKEHFEQRKVGSEQPKAGAGQHSPNTEQHGAVMEQRKADLPKKQAREKAADRVRRRSADTARQSVKTADQEVQAIKTVERGDKTIKQSARSTGKATVKTTQKSIKTAQQTARTTIKTSQTTAKAAQKSAQAAAKASHRAAQAARAAAKATAAGIKAAAKATAAAVKAIIAATKALVAAIAAGGWIAVAVIVIICLIGLIVGSCFGIFFSGEDTGTGQTMQTVVREINEDYENQLDTIKANISYDVLEMSGSRAVWPEVLSVYAVKTTTDPDNAMDVATVDDARKAILKDIFWQMNEIFSRTETNTETVIEESDDGNGNIVETTTTVTRTTLYITDSHKTAEEMADHFDFNADHQEQLSELLAEENNSLWAAVLYGIGVSDDAIVAVALSQVGNIGGQPYWSWYGFEGRVEWCACFVSWCANECGYIENGIIPKFAGCVNGVQWFKDRGQWADNSIEPTPGMIIFFDWDSQNGSSGPRTDSPTIWVSWKNAKTALSIPSREIPVIAAVRGSILWAIMKSLVMVFPPIKQDAVLPGGISLHTNFLRICSFLLCKHPYKFYLKIVSKKLLRDDL